MKVLLLTHRLPYAPNRGDRIRAYHLLQAIARSGDVHLVSLVHDELEESHAAGLRGLAASVTTVRVPALRNRARAVGRLAGETPLTHLLLDAPRLRHDVEAVAQLHPPDVVLAFCSGMAPLALEPPLSGLPLVLDMVDVDSAKWADLARVSRGPMSWVYAREARLLGAFERRASERASATLVTTAHEHETLAAMAPAARVHVVANGIDVDRFRPKRMPVGEPTVVFCGVMSYGPNRQAALWFARQVWPLVKARRPDARFTIVGAAPDAEVQALPDQDDSIRVTGAVTDVRPFLWRAALAVAPLQIARGVQNKVLEAVAAGLPCVVTPVVAKGLPPEVMPGCEVASAPEGYADAVVALLDRDPQARRARASAADLSALTWERQLHPAVGVLLDSVVDGRAGPRRPGPRTTDTRAGMAPMFGQAR